MTRPASARALAGGLALLLAVAPAASAAVSNAGGASAEFLRLGAGVRPAGMGEAFAPIAEGPEAIYWNPAGLAENLSPELGYSHASLYSVFQHDVLSYVQPVGRASSLAASAAFFYQDSLAAVDNANTPVGRFTPHSEAVTIACARAWSLGEDSLPFDRKYLDAGSPIPWSRHRNEEFGLLSLGVAFKAVNETLREERASALAVDGGALYRPAGFHRLSMSAVVRNVGSKPKFRDREESLPAEASLGVALAVSGERSRLLPALEFTVPYYGAPYAKAGLELSARLGDGIVGSVRGGYKTLAAPELGALFGLSVGVGIGLKQLDIDLAMEPRGVLGQVLRLGMSYRFGRPASAWARDPLDSYSARRHQAAARARRVNNWRGPEIGR